MRLHKSVIIGIQNDVFAKKKQKRITQSTIMAKITLQNIYHKLKADIHMTNALFLSSNWVTRSLKPSS